MFRLRTRPGIISIILVCISGSLPANNTDNMAHNRKNTLASWGVDRLQGKRPYQEDRYDVYIPEYSQQAVYAVYDGHAGAAMSEALSQGASSGIKPFAQTLYNNLSAHNLRNPAHIFTDWENQVYRAHGGTYVTNGSTAICAYCDTQTDTAYIYNIGDSRAVIVMDDNTIYASSDHTARTEYQRILDTGGTLKLHVGTINKDHNNRYRVTPSHGGVYTIDQHTLDTLVSQDRCPRVGDSVRGCAALIPSRTFGDYYHTHIISTGLGNLKKPDGVIAEPDVYGPFPLSRIKAIVLATDGVWDTVSNEQVRDIITYAYKSSYTAAKTASYIVQSAHGHDNTTALVIFPRYTQT